MKTYHYITILLAVFFLTSCASLRHGNDEYTYNGIDISHYQGNIDWNKLAKNRNIKFVYIKATEGSTWTDKYRQQYAEEASKRKLLVGFYHFFRASSSGAEQFENFRKATEGLPCKLIPVLDIEIEPKASEMAKFEDGIKTFIKLCRKYYGEYPIIYTTPYFDKKYLSFCSKYKKWYAGRISENAIMSKCVMWQVAIQPVPGIQGKADWDYCPSLKKIKK